MIRKLRIKFVAVNMLIVMSLLLLLLVFMARLMQNQIIRDELARLYYAAENAGYEPNRNRAESDALFFSCFTMERGVDGGLLVTGADIARLEPGQFEALYERVCAESEPDGVLPDYDLRYVRVDTLNGRKLAFGDMAGEHAATRYFRKVSILISIAAFVGFFLVSVVVSDWAVRPVEKLWQQRREFITNISHELKTPLTVVIANAELLQEPGFDEKQRGKFVRSILTMSMQMRHLVESMLGLMQLESTTEELGMAVLDLSGLVEECILPFEPLYYERSLHLTSEIEPGLTIFGNERALRRCVDILLDNAQKYSEPGTVHLRLRRAGSQAELTAANPSPELSRVECRDLFKRFYRRDAARTGDGSGSYGLGLPIAQKIVQHHDGKIDCTWEAGEIRFTVLLPLLTERKERREGRRAKNREG